MLTLLAVACAGIAPASIVMAQAPPAGTDPSWNFETKIRPILAGTCFRCHGGEKTEAGLRVDSREALLRGGDSGPALIPGDGQRSLLLQALRYVADGPQMPPEGQLPQPVLDDFSQWIIQGAVWPEASAPADRSFAAQHWAFQPVKSVDPPADPMGGSNHPIDRWLSARRREAGLTPVRAAERRTLLRRVTYDLTGLPPTPAEMAEFLADPAPEDAAWERTIDRLLSSPRYGERWGRHWMDVAHYADTAGDNADYPIPEIRLYRDYIIDAFNSDKPIDEFLREQLAGDLLAADGPPAEAAERVIATGYLALSRRYATAPFELWHLTLEDTLDTLGSSLLGMTLRCARCHDHKFDPITTRDYYALYGIFASTRFPYAGSEEAQSKEKPRTGFVPLVPDGEAVAQLAAYQAEIARREAELKQAEADRAEEKQIKKLRVALRTLRKRGTPEGLPVAYAVGEGEPNDVPVQTRGEPAQPGEVVPRGVPKILELGGPLVVPPGHSGRRELAQWITRADHPLTARVFVNRVWQHHFGQGLVSTPSNLGLRGALPTHPELLDWLAQRFVTEGWSLKPLHKLILTSATYRLASLDDATNFELDPANQYYWRYPRRRLDAESLRDTLLAASGKLDFARPGPHPFPAFKEWNWTQHSPFKAVYPSNHRSVYLMTQRIQRQPYLSLIDGHDTNHSTDLRTSATVPL
ncbi:MAG: PSD1 domain-containing protein, partial [Planctomycetaceae bacterium]|nr:PSD1 domain-containing protein [Planctomycetaceae bacterium]